MRGPSGGAASAARAPPAHVEPPPPPPAFAAPPRSGPAPRGAAAGDARCLCAAEGRPARGPAPARSRRRRGRRCHHRHSGSASTRDCGPCQNLGSWFQRWSDGKCWAWWLSLGTRGSASFPAHPARKESLSLLSEWEKAGIWSHLQSSLVLVGHVGDTELKGWRRCQWSYRCVGPIYTCRLISRYWMKDGLGCYFGRDRGIWPFQEHLIVSCG